jgi:superfamily II DNA/RNA helicase
MPELNTPTAPEAATASLPRFDDFGLAPPILQALADQGYQHPTPIQAQAIPVVLQGRDVMGAAQTGTGKTPDSRSRSFSSCCHTRTRVPHLRATRCVR